MEYKEYTPVSEYTILFLEIARIYNSIWGRSRNMHPCLFVFLGIYTPACGRALSEYKPPFEAVIKICAPTCWHWQNINPLLRPLSWYTPLFEAVVGIYTPACGRALCVSGNCWRWFISPPMSSSPAARRTTRQMRPCVYQCVWSVYTSVCECVYKCMECVCRCVYLRLVHTDIFAGKNKRCIASRGFALCCCFSFY